MDPSFCSLHHFSASQQGKGGASLSNHGLEGRVALVTGSSRGLGRAIALALAGAGADVVVHYRSKEQEALAVVEAIRKIGRQAKAVKGDVSSAEDCAQIFATAQSELGKVDILVNNAGILKMSKVEDISLEDFQQTMATNLTSAFVLTQAALPGMRDRGWGRIIYLSSVAAQNGGVTGPAYAASKAGLVGLTHSYARLLAPEGILVNAISPALVLTDMVQSIPGATPANLLTGDYGRPDEVGRVAVMLCLSDFMTGQTINVNGGMYMSS